MSNMWSIKDHHRRACVHAFSSIGFELPLSAALLSCEKLVSVPAGPEWDAIWWSLSADYAWLLVSSARIQAYSSLPSTYRNLGGVRILLLFVFACTFWRRFDVDYFLDRSSECLSKNRTIDKQ